ncbi:D-alanyl-D-alanine carboxypeptidase family protein [Microvirga thermotolerans]|uniref:D-alanyl-D-alanine carboxypeptidase n=1 Tax=Microvirga thermotolerans TaxID=2651334 RepID=A0A5P9JSW9_9HYPH|nr:D-alanyl-D-alanine carboxypeptidase family protein [Microvirga thermotolerans]QFU15201.1 D-alanyl-D-alanine carboxypeptidase [Microvirga thermotolerans]
MNVSRALRVTAFALAALVGGLMGGLMGAPALAGGPALVVEADTGRVLHAERATDPWYPASITKLMTTYVALDAVRSGRAKMDTLLTVSEQAAALPPSKMGFKPGTQIRLDNALKIIMVKSANDVAATIAEGLGGSIEAFAEMMNERAQALGMRDSHFANPHGLPDERNQTTARDMAILARALFNEFPEYQGLFDIGAIQYGRRIMRNTNGLIGRYPGADGMKTGFICSAGFNVVASATRNGRHLITVVLGAPSANERTMKAAELFDRGFSSLAGPANPTLAALPASSARTPPDMRSVICDRRGPMPEEEDSQTTVASSESTGIPNLFSSDVMAFAGTSQPTRTVLGPRAAVQPERVWVGLNPPSEAELAAQAAKEEAAEKARKAASKKAAKKDQAKAAAKDKSAKDKAAGEKDAQDAKDTDTASASPKAGGKSKARESISMKPVSDQKGKPKPAKGKDQASADTSAKAKNGKNRPEAN